jgi:enoyl-CoA hydratase
MIEYTVLVSVDSAAEVMLETDGGVARIRLHAPERRNALTPSMAAELRGALRKAEDDPSIGAIVVEAAGPDFCAGADLQWLRETGRDALSSTSFNSLGEIYGMFSAFRRAAVPTVAAIGGRLVGAGINVALMCDVRVIADDAILIGFSEANVHPGGGHIEMLLDVAPSLAAALVLFGRRITAEEAAAAGFAIECVSRARLHETAMRLATPAASDPALARRITETFRTTHGAPGPGVMVERAPQLWSLQRAFKSSPR